MTGEWSEAYIYLELSASKFYFWCMTHAFFFLFFFFCECAKSSWLFHTFWLAKHETMLAGDNSLINIEASIL